MKLGRGVLYHIRADGTQVKVADCLEFHVNCAPEKVTLRAGPPGYITVSATVQVAAPRLRVKNTAPWKRDPLSRFTR